MKIRKKKQSRRFEDCQSRRIWDFIFVNGQEMLELLVKYNDSHKGSIPCHGELEVLKKSYNCKYHSVLKYIGHTAFYIHHSCMLRLPYLMRDVQFRSIPSYFFILI